MSERVGIGDAIRLQAEACRRAGSVLYERICGVVLDDVAAGGPCAEVLRGHESDPFGSVPVLRLLGGVHRVVLDGRAPALAAAYPSAGGSTDVDPVAPFLATVADHRAELVDRMAIGVQTNEVARSVPLMAAFHTVAEATRLPLRLLELGSSAGLNLRWDRYWYEDVGWGDPNATLRFADGFVGPRPTPATDLRVAERRGVDANPLDATTDEGRLTLLSYLWPDQVDRFRRLEAAIEVARLVPATIDRADGVEWVERQLAEAAEGCTTVLFHSIVLMYLSPEARRRLSDVVHAAGARATASSPLAHVAMEIGGDQAQVHLTAWPGGHKRLLADCGFHGPPVHWHPA